MQLECMEIAVIVNIWAQLHPRTRWYISVSAGLSLLALTQLFWTFKADTEIHTLIELCSTVLALLVGVEALIRFFVRQQSEILALGLAFLGTGLLDAYHTLATSHYAQTLFPSPPDALIPWSWSASRTFLALFLCLTWVYWRTHNTDHEQERQKQRQLTLLAIVATLASALFFAYVPLGPAHFPDLVFKRPQELITGIFFLIALSFYLRKQFWRSRSLDHWLILALILNVFCQLVFMPFSAELFDAPFILAHLLKLISYALVLVGFMTDVREMWQRESEMNQVIRESSLRLAQKSDELSRSNQELQRSNVELQKFVYIASHDLQSPLRSISGFVQLLQRQYKDQLDTRAMEWIQRTVDSTTQMQTLLQDLMTYSQLSSDEQKEWVDLNQIVEDFKQKHKQQLRESGAQIRSSDLPRVFGNPKQLELLIHQFLDNALKYRHPERQLSIELTAERENELWRFVITDNGLGIEPEYQSRIFDMFQRLHGQESYQGTGIGLALCQRIVELLGGQIGVQSDGKTGSRFWFTIKRSAPTNDC